MTNSEDPPELDEKDLEDHLSEEEEIDVISEGQLNFVENDLDRIKLIIVLPRAHYLLKNLSR